MAYMGGVIRNGVFVVVYLDGVSVMAYSDGTFDWVFLNIVSIFKKSVKSV